LLLSLWGSSWALRMRPSSVRKYRGYSSLQNAQRADAHFGCEQYGEKRRAFKGAAPRSSARGLLGALELLARELVGARLLEDVRAFRESAGERELDRGVAAVADQADVGAVAQEQLHHLGVAAQGRVHERRVAVLGPE